MAAKKLPQLRDFSKGRVTTYSANTSLIPANSVSNSYNVNFDSVLGAGQARLGTTALGSVVASGKTALGLGEFVSSGATTNVLLSVFSGATTATIYYFDTAWHASSTTTLSNTAKCRFATLGGRVFLVNGATMLSSADGNTWDTTNCITTNSVVPSLIYKFSARLLASGYSSFKDRVYFSSIIDLNASPTLVWNTDPATGDLAGDWIDVNPDDGDNVTGFSDISSVMLVFKKNNFYRLNVVAKAVDPESIFNVGAPSQEAITKCQGMVYFYSGGAVYRTNGGYPEQISRLGFQDFIDAVPQTNWGSVAMGADEFNVYISLGQVTVNGMTNYIVGKFSTRDESWSVHYYPVIHKLYAKWTDTNGRKLRFVDSLGFGQTLNLGTTDNATPIFYQLDTQDIEFGQRGASNVINDKFSVFTRNAQGSTLKVKEENGDYRDLQKQLLNPVETIENCNIKARYFRLRWSGTYSSGKSPTLEGFEFPDVTDEGVIL